MYNFTDSPFEKMMKQRPPGYREPVAVPPPDSPCRGCTIWRGMACMGLCRRKILCSHQGLTFFNFPVRWQIYSLPSKLMGVSADNRTSIKSAPISCANFVTAAVFPTPGAPSSITGVFEANLKIFSFTAFTSFLHPVKTTYRLNFIVKSIAFYIDNEQTRHFLFEYYFVFPARLAQIHSKWQRESPYDLNPDSDKQ